MKIEQVRNDNGEVVSLKSNGVEIPLYREESKGRLDKATNTKGSDIAFHSLSFDKLSGADVIAFLGDYDKGGSIGVDMLWAQFNLKAKAEQLDGEGKDTLTMDKKLAALVAWLDRLASKSRESGVAAIKAALDMSNKKNELMVRLVAAMTSLMSAKGNEAKAKAAEEVAKLQAEIASLG